MKKVEILVEPYTTNDKIHLSKDSSPSNFLHKIKLYWTHAMSVIADFIPFVTYKKRPYERKRSFISREFSNRIIGVLIAVATVSAFFTYAALSDDGFFEGNHNAVIWLLNFNLVVLFALVTAIAHRVVSLWSGRKRGIAGSHLHVRLVFTFSILAAAPAILMAVFSALFFHYGIQTWFSERVQTAINESHAVAHAYLDEHKQIIRADALAVANDIYLNAPSLISNRVDFKDFVQEQSFLRNLSEIVLFDSEQNVVARSNLTFSLEFEDVPDYAIRQADRGEVVLITNDKEDRIRVLIKLTKFFNMYLYVGRMVDAQVLAHMDATQKAVSEYNELRTQYFGVQVTSTLIFVVVGLLMLLAAIGFGLLLARQLVSPISTMIAAADRVRAGDFTAHVPETDKIQEFDYLARAFNRMTKQIHEQQEQLISANRQLDQRRRFTEGVLSGVTSGVISLDEQGVVLSANSSACELLEIELKDLKDNKIQVLVPEFESVLLSAFSEGQGLIQREFEIQTYKDARKSLHVQIVIENTQDQKTAILTFDDITALKSAQRKAAWSDVARRIAHEIKNPLTPIQLSAERLRKKYSSQISSDRDIFDKCIDTIIKQVGDIGMMVSEFSDFARMPSPKMAPNSLAGHLEDIVVFHRQANPEIMMTTDFSIDLKKPLLFDASLIRQAFSNILINAIDAVAEKRSKDKDISPHIHVLVEVKGGKAFIVVSDNGAGLPPGQSAMSLTEPYVTHKKKGTGLGLAIVKKIMEEHGGEIIINDDELFQELQGFKSLGGLSIALVLNADNDQASE